MIECKNICEENHGEKIPSFLDFNFDIMRSQSYQTLQSRELPSLEGIWTDGKFDYDNEKWTDAFGTPIPDYFWENSTLLRKVFDQITQII